MDERKPTVLVVDDALPNLDILIGLLKEEYRIKPATNGQRALDMLAAEDLPDLILLDIMLPDIGGFEVCQQLKADPRLRNIPVVFISALERVHDKVAAFEVGGVDYITKPFHAIEVRARVRNHLELARMRQELATLNRELETRVRHQIDKIAAGHFAVLFALTELAESRDGTTGRHLDRVQSYCRVLACHLSGRRLLGYPLNLELVETIARASSLHDIGKVAVPDRILLKPTRLSAAEFETMKEHTTKGSRTLELVCARHPENAFLRIGAQIARSHHERWDGSGYPDGQERADIPIPARIVALVDVYDALRTERPYKDAFTHERSRDVIVEASGKHFDPVIVSSFLAVQEELNTIAESE